MNEEEEIRSPCIKICEFESRTGECRACLRTIQEISGWSDFDNAQKKEVLTKIEERRKKT